MANLVSGGNGASYTYVAGGARTAYTMNAAGNTAAGNIAAAGNASGSAPQAGATYANYGYNGEYTHENLGIQYLRERYYSMETGTFTSKDTYAGKLTDILSQNRYTYAENNQITFADPSGHAAMLGALNKVTSAVKKAADKAVNNTAIATKSAGTNKLALPRINNHQNLKLPGISAVPVTTVQSQVFASIVVGHAAVWIKQKSCEAYNYCVNKKQEIISERMTTGGDLLKKAWNEAIGGSTILVLGATTWETGWGLLGIPVGLFGLVSAISDTGQAMEEIEYGWNGNKTAESSNFLRDTLFSGHQTAYDSTTKTVATLGEILMIATYPILSTTTIIPPGSGGGNTAEQTPPGECGRRCC